MTTRAPNSHTKSANGKWQSLSDTEILSLQLLERRHGTTAAARMVGVTVTTFEVIAAGRGASPKARKLALLSVKDILRGWVKLSGEERRELVRDLAKKCFLTADQAPRFEWTTADELAAEAEES